MNATQTPRPRYTETDISHPKWCAQAGWCTVRIDDGRIVGTHYTSSFPMQTMFGHVIRVQIEEESGDDGHPRVSLRRKLDEESDWEWPTVLEPEEAEFLARLLTETAAEWRQIRGQR